MRAARHVGADAGDPARRPNRRRVPRFFPLQFAPLSASSSRPAKESDTKTTGGNATASGITVERAHAGCGTGGRDAPPGRRPGEPPIRSHLRHQGDTHAYALLLADGRVADLDEGGNTFADAAVKADPQGRAMLAGQGPGFKPIVTVTGHVQVRDCG